MDCIPEDGVGALQNRIIVVILPVLAVKAPNHRTISHEVINKREVLKRRAEAPEASLVAVLLVISLALPLCVR